MRDRDPPNGFASATMKELIFCRRCPASRMNCKLGSCTAFSYRSLFFVNHSLLLFFARSRKNAKNSVVKYVDFSPMRGPPRVRIRFPQFERSLGRKTLGYVLDSARGAELVSVMDHAGLALLTQFPERRLDLHPDLDVFRLDIDQLGRQADALVHLDDRHDVRFLHLELRGRVVDDCVRHDGAFALELHPLHLPDGPAPARRAHGPRRKVDFAAAPALRADQIVAALDLPPETRDCHLSPPARRYGRPPWPPCRRACA